MVVYCSGSFKKPSYSSERVCDPLFEVPPSSNIFARQRVVAPSSGRTPMVASRGTGGSRINVNRSDSHWKELRRRSVQETGRVLLRHSKVNAPVFRLVYQRTVVRPAARDKFWISDRYQPISPDRIRVSKVAGMIVVSSHVPCSFLLACETGSKIIRVASVCSLL